MLRYRKAATYGFHVLLGALEEHDTATSYEVVFTETAEATIAEIQAGLRRSRRVLVLWSFYSPTPRPSPRNWRQSRRSEPSTGKYPRTPGYGAR
ncbi:hypothetical protein [Dactylosporangium sp. CA-092794]|uniref:hypothetical protein n=1 Tax=Dactylosporangium sp. CA-092794 TaxID=3239929 RepID=UPI003D94F7F7